MTTARRRAAALLVTAQFALLSMQVVLRRRRDCPTPPIVRVAANMVQAAGVMLATAAATNLGAGLTASPLPNNATQLRSTGLYAHIRHPIYSGLMLASVGHTVAGADRRQIPLTGALIGLLTYKSMFEEAALRDVFASYAGYQAVTPRFVSRIRRMNC